MVQEYYLAGEFLRIVRSSSSNASPCNSVLYRVTISPNRFNRLGLSSTRGGVEINIRLDAGDDFASEAPERTLQRVCAMAWSQLFASDLFRRPMLTAALSQHVVESRLSQAICELGHRPCRPVIPCDRQPDG